MNEVVVLVDQLLFVHNVLQTGSDLLLDFEHLLDQFQPEFGIEIENPTIEEFLSTLAQEIGCRESTVNGFTLFSDDPIEKNLEHFIPLDAKVCLAFRTIIFIF